MMWCIPWCDVYWWWYDCSLKRAQQYKSTLRQPPMWVFSLYVCVIEWMLYCFPIIYVFECCNFFSNWVFVNFNQFPPEKYFNSSFVALIKCNFICISEFINFFIWCPVLDLCVSSRSSKNFILSHEWFIIKSIEISSFTFIWEFWWVANKISVCIIPSVIIISICSFLCV